MYQKYETERFLLIHFLFLYCPVEIYKRSMLLVYFNFK